MTAAFAPPPGSRIWRPTFLPKQQEFMLSLAPEVLFSGAWGAGKSRVGCSKILMLAMRYPGSVQGICRKKLTSLKATTMETFFREVCPPELVVNWNKTERVLTVKAGPQLAQTSQIRMFGLVNEAGQSLNIRSLTLGSCFLDETVEATDLEWEELGGRLRDTASGLHQMMGATNPANRAHWAYQRFFQNPTAGVTHTIQATALENPYLPADYVERIKRLKGRYFDRYVLGKWVDFEGLVYDVFDPLLHQITWTQFAERFGQPAIPPDWTRVRAVDFGYHNPFVCQWWGVSPDAEWFRYREIYYSRRLVEDHAKQIVGLSEGEKILCAYADHDAEDRATAARYGVPTTPANKEVSPGIQTVYQLLRPDDVTGRPRMYFLRDVLVEEDPALVNQNLPTCTEAEIQGYHYPQGTDLKNPKEEPVKVNDHGCDSMRYAAHTHTRGGAGMGALIWMQKKAAEARAKRAAAGERAP